LEEEAMRGLTRVGLGRRLGAPLLVAGVCAGFAASALAAGNTVTAQPPTNARVNVPYRIRLRGHANTAETLYMFLDYKACRRTPAGEHKRANGVIFHVQGTFAGKSPRFVSHARGTDHVCAYLVPRSAPRNPTGRVLAHDFVSYRVR
jgi:hypothetical protein